MSAQHISFSAFLVSNWAKRSSCPASSSSAHCIQKRSTALLVTVWTL